MVEAFSGEVKVPVGLAGQGRAFGVGKLADLGELSPRKPSGSNGGGRGGRWVRAACFGFRFILKKKKLLLFFLITKVIHACCGNVRMCWKAK